MGVDNIDAIDFEMIKYKREKCSLHVTASELVPFLEQQSVSYRYHIRSR